MKEPNFFIIGAPKCGTTSLARWLSQHPEVFMSPVKEPHYFSDDFPLGNFRAYEDYQALFSYVSHSHKAVGEASVWYLRSRVAVPKIEKYTPSARYIVMLRNPVEMAPSLHWQVLFSGDETVKDFKKAWGLQDQREAGVSIPKKVRCNGVVNYRSACKLGEQLTQLYGVVGRDRVLPIFLEDLQKDIHCEWARILRFLDVSYWNDLDFKPENRATEWSMPWVREIARVYRKTLNWANIKPLGLGIFSQLKKLAIREAKWKPLDEELRRRLVHEFRDDIEIIENLTGRNLDHWKKHDA